MVILLLTISTLTGAGAVQSAEQRYLDAIAAFRAGRNDQAVAGLATLADRDVMQQAGRFGRQRPVTAAEWRAWSADVRGALVLHTAVWAARRIEGPPPAADVHGRAARMLARLLLQPPDPRPAARRDTNRELARVWYLLVAATLHAALDIERSRAHLAEARRTFPDDALILLASGADHEALSAVTMGTMPYRDIQGVRVSQERVDSVRELRQAVVHYRAALAVDPHLHEARLRLGRTLHQLGRTEAARAELAQVHAADTEPPLRYLAAVFLGLIEAAAQNTTRARALYEEATRIDPGGHAVLVARSELAFRTGAFRDAAREMRALLLRDEVSDPWWGYLLGTGWHRQTLEELIARLARE